MRLKTFETLILIVILVVAALFLGQGLKSGLKKVTQTTEQKIVKVKL